MSEIELLRRIMAIEKELATLRAVERPVACRWRGNLAGPPANVRDGDVYFDTGAGFAYIYANGGWVVIG